MELLAPFPSCPSLLCCPEGSFGCHLIREMWLVLNLLHVGITWEALNITDDLVGVSPEILM